MKNKILLPLSVGLVTLNPFYPLKAHTKDQKKPNILFILVDDLGWNDISCMGSKYYETPNIDKIAKKGMLFTDAYATCSVSSPSRSSIMTGQYPVRTGITDWIGEKSGKEWRTMNRNSKLLPASYNHNLALSQVTIAEALKANGYRTMIAGKWHLGENPKNWPKYQGFDVNKGGYSGGGPRGGYFSPWDNPKLENKEDGENLSMRLAKETVKFMKDKSKKPFFCYLSFYAVHGGIQSTMEKWKYFRDKAEKMGIAKKGFAIDKTLPVRLHQDNPVYAGLISLMDDAVGYVFDNMEQLGLDKNTIIIFTGDNGGVVSGDSYSSCLFPLRGGKGRQWEGGIREPLLIYYPGIKAGSICHTPVTGTDYYPTLLDYAGIPLMPKQHKDGVSILPLTKGEKIADRSLFWHYPHYGNQGGEPCSTIRKGDWKLIYYYEDERCELYNLKTDIGEHEPLNIQHMDKVKELKAELMQWLKDTHALIPKPDMQYDPIKEAETKYKWKTKLLENKEKERKKELDPNWKPNKDWWGSLIVND